jgi:hypothetical protein
MEERERGCAGVGLIRGGGKERQSQLLEGRKLSCKSHPPPVPASEGGYTRQDSHCHLPLTCRRTVPPLTFLPSRTVAMSFLLCLQATHRRGNEVNTRLRMWSHHLAPALRCARRWRDTKQYSYDPVEAVATNARFPLLVAWSGSVQAGPAENSTGGRCDRGRILSLQQRASELGPCSPTWHQRGGADQSKGWFKLLGSWVHRPRQHAGREVRLDDPTTSPERPMHAIFPVPMRAKQGIL